jgi:hypothetical protein
MGFFSSLFGGSSPTLNAGIKAAGDTASFATGFGKNLSTQAGNFYSDLMSGDPAKVAKLLAPQIKSQQDQAQQARQGMAQFGTRSGGTAAKGQTLGDTTRANIGTMVSDLTGKAVAGAQQMGQSMLDTGIKSLDQQFQFSQAQMENWSNSILGTGLTAGAGFLEKAGLNAIPGMG